MKTGPLDLAPGSVEVGAIEVPPFEKPERQFELANLIEVKFEVAPAVRDGAGRPYLGVLGPTLVVRRKNHPCSAFRAEDARANNAIGHHAIIGSHGPLHRRTPLRLEKVAPDPGGCPQFKRNASWIG